MEGNRTLQGAHSLRSTQRDDAELVLSGHSAWPSADPRAALPDRFFMHAPAGILELDAEGCFLRVNPAFCRMTGYWPEELVGRSLAEFVASPEEVERLRDLLYHGTGVEQFEVGCIRRDATVLQTRVTAGVVPPAEARSAATLIALVEDAAGVLSWLVDEGARVDAVETVAGAVARAREAAEEQGIGIAFAYASDPVWVRADGIQLRRALDDLLDHAVRSRQVGTLAVRCTSDEDDALLELVAVPEMDAAGLDMQSAFVPAPDMYESRDITSLGSMLTLVQAHNGDIEMTESASSGSRITVRLPLAPR